MKRIKYFKESTNVSKYKGMEDFISSIWYITEDEIFDAFVELHDGMDVSIEIKFYLKGVEFQHELQKSLTIDTPPGKLNLERTEAYAAAGLTPCIEILITSNESVDKDRRMHSYAIESLYHIEDYSLYDVKRGKGYLKLNLKYDENSIENKTLYHKKSARSFNEILQDLIKNGYKCDVSRVFLKNSKMNLMHTTGSVPMYYITLEKTYRMDIEMIDHLSKDKTYFIKATESLFNLPDIYQVEHKFDIETSKDDQRPTMKNEIRVIFEIYAYEE